MSMTYWHVPILYFVLLHLSIICSTTKVPSNVIQLNEKFLDYMNEGFWLVEFYAPWCAHCKRLQPVWEQVGHSMAEMNSIVHVGKVDCTKYPEICSQLNIRGYPTIIFFRNGVKIPYEGERRKDDITKFTEKSSGPVINKLTSISQFDELTKTSENEPFFVFVSGKTINEDLYADYKNASEMLFTEIRFFETIPSLQLPIKGERTKSTIIVFKDSGYDEFESTGTLFEWILRARWPMLPKVTPINLQTIGESCGKKLVLALIDHVDRLNSSTESGRFFKLIKEMAIEAQRDDELKSRFQFGWTPDSSMANSIVMGRLSIPNLFVLNYSSYEFYTSNDSPDQMTIQSISAFLQEIIQETIHPQGGRMWITRLRRMFYDISTNIYDMFYHQPVLTVCLFGVPLAFLSIIIYTICSSEFSVDREEIYPEDESDGGNTPMDDSDHEKAD